MPEIILTATRYYHRPEIHPSFTNEVCLLVVIKHGNFKLVVVGRFVDGETQFLVPTIVNRQSCKLCEVSGLTISASVLLFCLSQSSLLPFPIS